MKAVIDSKLREDLEFQLEYHQIGKHLGYNDSALALYLCDVLLAIEKRGYIGGDIVMVALPCKNLKAIPIK